MNFKLQRDQVIEILHQPQRSHVTIKIILFFWHNYRTRTVVCYRIASKAIFAD